jgi:hypothetical protein
MQVVELQGQVRQRMLVHQWSCFGKYCVSHQMTQSNDWLMENSYVDMAVSTPDHTSVWRESIETRIEEWGKLWKTLWLHHSKIHNDSWQQNQQFHQCRDVLNIHILITVIKRRWNRSSTYLIYQWQIVWFYFLHIYTDFALRVQVVFATKEMNRILENCQVWQDKIFFLYIKAPIQAGKIWNFPKQWRLCYTDAGMHIGRLTYLNFSSQARFSWSELFMRYLYAPAWCIAGNNNINSIHQI